MIVRFVDRLHLLKQEPVDSGWCYVMDVQLALVVQIAAMSFQIEQMQ